MPGLADADRDDGRAHAWTSVGRRVWVEDEAMLDAVTAVSGSGPAYVFYFMEAMHTAALGMGFDDEQARALTLATFIGADAAGGRTPTEPASVLRERVTSKGGTTAAALAVMAARGVDRQHRRGDGGGALALGGTRRRTRARLSRRPKARPRSRAQGTRYSSSEAGEHRRAEPVVVVERAEAALPARGSRISV